MVKGKDNAGLLWECVEGGYQVFQCLSPQQNALWRESTFQRVVIERGMVNFLRADGPPPCVVPENISRDLKDVAVEVLDRADVSLADKSHKHFLDEVI